MRSKLISKANKLKVVILTIQFHFVGPYLMFVKTVIKNAPDAVTSLIFNAAVIARPVAMHISPNFKLLFTHEYYIFY